MLVLGLAWRRAIHADLQAYYFGVGDRAATALSRVRIVFGPLTEVPVMQRVVKAVNMSKGWYEAGSQA